MVLRKAFYAKVLETIRILSGRQFGIFGFFVFNGISTFVGLFNAEAILFEEQWSYYLTHSLEDEGVHTFLKGICPKVNVIERLEYELAYYDSVVHRFNHYTTRITPGRQSLRKKRECLLSLNIISVEFPKHIFYLWSFYAFSTVMTKILAQRLECSPMARETWVQSQVESYQRL